MTDTIKKIRTPLSDDVIMTLAAGDPVRITGTIYTARDAAHKKMAELLTAGEPLPFDPQGAVVYYAGPTPPRPGFPIGSVGPTTSGRMDAYSPLLIARGLKVMIGKGLRNEATKRAIMEECGLYLAAIGGAGALISKCVKSASPVAFEELGTEAVRKLEVVDFPAIVAIDCFGNDIYERETLFPALGDIRPHRPQ